MSPTCMCVLGMRMHGRHGEWARRGVGPVLSAARVLMCVGAAVV